MHKPPESARSGAKFDLLGIDRELRLEELYQKNGHAARTLVRSKDLRVVLMVMRANSHIAEHRVSETASVQVLSGKLRLELPSGNVELEQGQLLVLDADLPHDVEAVDDAAFILTLGWHGDG